MAIGCVSLQLQRMPNDPDRPLGSLWMRRGCAGRGRKDLAVEWVHAQSNITLGKRLFQPPFSLPSHHICNANASLRHETKLSVHTILVALAWVAFTSPPLAILIEEELHLCSSLRYDACVPLE
jgi:hypothetical protein